VLQELLAMHSADPSSKALIFSSFQGTVDYLKEVLPTWGFGFRYINGGCSGKPGFSSCVKFSSRATAAHVRGFSRYSLLLRKRLMRIAGNHLN
jgi:hypothetical protein